MEVLSHFHLDIDSVLFKVVCLVISVMNLTTSVLYSVVIKTHSFDYGFKTSDYLGRKETLSGVISDLL
jgi:hypothetical protein